MFEILSQHNKFNISSRRYLGNKFKLTSWIRSIVDNNCTNVQSFFDVFSGTGSVASAFIDKRLVVCDILYSNYIAALCWFSPQIVNLAKLSDLINYYNHVDTSNENNYVSLNFSDTYFDKQNCQRIGFIREDIEKRFIKETLNERERAILITSLIYAMDRISHTCGHYDAFLRDGQYSGFLKLRMPDIKHDLNVGNEIYCADSNLIAPEIRVDVAYLDPPYNSRQYCDAYHFLENIARWQKPEVTGVARKMDRSGLKSDYCTSKAATAFSHLIESIKARYILLSYNNMSEKGNMRSNAKLTDEVIMQILSSKGRVQVFSENYKAFTAGKSNITDNAERLFLCTCDI